MQVNTLTDGVDYVERWCSRALFAGGWEPLDVGGDILAKIKNIALFCFKHLLIRVTYFSFGVVKIGTAVIDVASGIRGIPTVLIGAGINRDLYRGVSHQLRSATLVIPRLYKSIIDTFDPFVFENYTERSLLEADRQTDSILDQADADIGEITKAFQGAGEAIKAANAIQAPGGQAGGPAPGGQVANQAPGGQAANQAPGGQAGGPAPGGQAGGPAPGGQAGGPAPGGQAANQAPGGQPPGPALLQPKPRVEAAVKEAEKAADAAKDPQNQNQPNTKKAKAAVAFQFALAAANASRMQPAPAGTVLRIWKELAKRSVITWIDDDNFLKRILLARIGCLAMHLVSAVCRVADLIIGVASGAFAILNALVLCGCGFWGPDDYKNKHKSLNVTAYNHLQIGGVLRDLFKACVTFINPSVTKRA